MRYLYLIICLFLISCNGEIEKKIKSNIAENNTIIVENIKPNNIEYVCPNIPMTIEYKNEMLRTQSNFAQFLESIFFRISTTEPSQILKYIVTSVLKDEISSILNNKNVKLNAHYGIGKNCRGWVYVLDKGNYDHYYFMDCNGNYVEQRVDKKHKVYKE
jgi:hypothetical protein